MSQAGSGKPGETGRRRFVVLDRDGTIIEERNYLSDPDRVAILPGAVEGMIRFREMGLGLAIVTNQSGIGRGYFDLDRLELIHQRMATLLEAHGVLVDGIYFCPHTPEDGCQCRKPETGLMEQASRELDFDPADSFVIGDKVSDIELGRRVGATTFLVSTGYGAETAREGSADAAYMVDGLEAAAAIVQTLLFQRGGFEN